MPLYKDMRLEKGNESHVKIWGEIGRQCWEDAAAGGAASEQHADRDGEIQAHWIASCGDQGRDIRPAVAVRHAQTYSRPRGREASDLDPNLASRRKILRHRILPSCVFF